MKGILTLYRGEQEKLSKTPIYSAPFSEDKIKKKSIEMFSEPEPCAMYRAACSSALALEFISIADLELKEDAGKVLRIEDLPNEISKYFTFPEYATHVMFE